MSKEYNKRRLSIAIRIEEYDAVAKEAEKQRRSISDTIGLLISKYLMQDHNETDGEPDVVEIKKKDGSIQKVDAKAIRALLEEE